MAKKKTVQSKKVDKGNIGYSVFLLIVSVTLLVVSAVKQTSTTKDNNTLKKEIAESVAKQIDESLKTEDNSEYPDYSSLKNLKYAKIIENFESWTPNSGVQEKMTWKKILVTKGQLSKGYIYIKASIDGKPLSNWESVYISMNRFGGHLFRPQSLPLPKSDKTELLYSLNDVPYLPTSPYREQVTPLRTSNWYSELKSGRWVYVFSFISSLKPAILENVTIYYDCVQSSDCAIEIK